jgi:hypothetical protein
MWRVVFVFKNWIFLQSMLLVPDPMTIGRDEKGIRLKTGAVPAAVSS